MEVAMHWANDYAEALVRVPPFVPTPANLRFKRAMKTIDDVVYRLIRERRAAENKGDDLLGMLMESTDDGTAMDDQQLRDEVITMVLAGHETTANLLSWTFRLLSQHPDVARRAREEALRVLGDREPALSDVKSLEYTRRVLDEALRLYPPAWMFERQAIEDDVLGGYPIAKGSIVGFCPYVMHRHPAHWENPEGFDPDRFSPERSQKRPRYAYLPFGGGPRTCIGNHFAMMEAQIILAMVLREHRIELDPSHPVVLDPVITLRPKHGIHVRRRPASPREADPARRRPIESPVARA
jgi:cytochrome P450